MVHRRLPPWSLGRVRVSRRAQSFIPGGTLTRSGSKLKGLKGILYPPRVKTNTRGNHLLSRHLAPSHSPNNITLPHLSLRLSPRVPGNRKAIILTLNSAHLPLLRRRRLLLSPLLLPPEIHALITLLLISITTDPLSMVRLTRILDMAPHLPHIPPLPVPRPIIAIRMSGAASRLIPALLWM